LVDDTVQLSLVGNGLTQPAELLLGQGHGDSFASYFTGPNITTPLLRGFALKDAALRKETQTGQSPL